MIKVRKKGIQRFVTEESFNRKWKALGFDKVEEEEEVKEEGVQDLTVKEIKHMLDENNIEYDSTMKKAELLELLEVIDSE